SQMLDTIFSASSQSPPPDLIKRLVDLAVSAADETTVTKTVRHLEGRAGVAPAADVQLAGLAGLLDGLDARHLSLADFQKESGPELQNDLQQLHSIFAQARQLAMNEN